MEWTKEQILEEIARIKYLYKVKGIIRYGRERDPWERAESVAEHVYAMMVLVNYFIPLEDPEGKLDRARIMDMALVHDIDEIENGDIINYKKTDEDRLREEQDMQTALDSIPQSMTIDTRALVDEYNKQETRESQFVKAIDKVEPVFELFDKYGKTIVHKNKTTYEQFIGPKSSYIRDFPMIVQFVEIMTEEMMKQGYFDHADE